MVTIVCGSRSCKDRGFVWGALDVLHGKHGFTKVVHGFSGKVVDDVVVEGADLFAAEWAVSRRVPVKGYPANWRDFGLSAGPIRNRQMLREETPELVVAFPGGRGTESMVVLSRCAKVRIVLVPASLKSLAL